ncbi:MAG TPA: hypothetical protein VGO11_17380 [Chthoniobacteraceae bacterium]|jgi:thioredoxin-like negative regulator of GroEL|nr:hypothetical protein [Chthoniobacteraceae bacterium]
MSYSRLLVGLGLLGVFGVARGAEPPATAAWPAAVEQYEKAALLDPNADEPLYQLRNYARESGRLAELKQRWEALATGPDEWRYRLLIAQCAVLAVDLPATRVELQRVTRLAPKSAEAWLALGKFEMWQGTPEAQPALEQARDLAADPSRAIVMMVKDHLDRGRKAEALAVLGQRWPEVRNTALMTRLLESWGKTALAEGRFAQALEPFEGRRDPDAAGVVAGLYASIKDYSMAAAVLDQARATWPADIRLRERALAVERAAGDSSEALRLVREAAWEHGSAATWGELLTELLRNGVAEEAGRLLDAHPSELATQAARWRVVLPEAVQLGLGARVDAALASAPDLWEAVFTRGELAMIEARYPAAQKILWSLFEPRFERQPFSSQAPDRFNRFPGYYMYNVYSHLTAGDRYTHVRYLYGTMAELFRQPEHRIESPFDVLISSQDARDFALCLLGMIALETKSEAAFQAELTARIAAWSEEDRLVAALVAGTTPAMVTAIEAYAEGKQRMPATDRECIAQLKRVETSPETDPALLSKVRALPARLAATAPKPLPMKMPPAKAPVGPPVAVRPLKPQPYKEPYDEFVKGRFAQALELYYGVLRATRETGDSLSSYTMDYAVTIAQHRGSPAQTAEAGATAFALLFPPTYQAPKLDRPFESADLWAPTQPARSYSMSYGRPGTGGPIGVERLPKEVQPKLVYPPKSLLSWAETGVLWTIFGETREPAVWAALQPRLETPPAGAPPAQELHWRVARSYLAWWHGEYQDAIGRMRQLLQESGDDGVRLGLAGMLLREGDRPGATALLAEIKPPYPAYARVHKSWALRMAAEAHDAAEVAALIGEVADSPLEPETRRELAKAVQAAGFPEEAERLHAPLLAALEKEEDWRRLNDGLREFSHPMPPERAVALARRVLAVSPRCTPTDLMFQRFRSTAWNVLRAAGAQSYLAELKAGTGGDPVERQWRIAEASPGEESLPAWARLLEMDPANVMAAEHQTYLQTKDPERWRIFDAILGGDAESLMQSRSGEIAQAYLDGGQVPKLLARVAATRFYGPVARRGEASDDQWRRIATGLAQAGEHDAAIAVLRKALALTDAPPGALQRLLVQELDRAGRHEELGRELLTMLAPQAVPSTTPFHLQEERRGRTEVSRPAPGFDPAILALARKAGVLDEARARLEKAAAGSPAARRSRLLLGALEHEAAVLPELETLAGGAFRPDEQPWLTALAEALAGWPEAAAPCRQIVAKLEPLLPRDDRAGTARLALARLAFRCEARPLALKLARQAKEAALAESRVTRDVRLLTPVVVLAREAGDASLLAECADAFVTWLASLEVSNMYERSEATRVLSLYLDGNDTASAEKIIAAARKQAGAKPDQYLEESLARYLDEVRARAGDLTNHAPMVWLDADRTTEKTATLVWDLALHRADDKQGRFSVTDQEVPGLAGKYDVELFFGEEPDALVSLARFPKAAVRGEWKGALPASFGFAQAVFTRGEQVLRGPILPVCAGPNLLKGDAAQGNRFPPGVPLPARGGPSPGGSAIVYRDANSSFAGGVALAARRVAVEPGHDYALAGWLRSVFGDRALRLSWRFLDKDGRELANSQASDVDSDPRYWSYHWLRLTWTQNPPGGGYVSFPEGTAFLEPAIRGGADGFDLAGFYLIELPETRNRP